MVMKRSGSSVVPETYESVPCGFSLSALPPSSQSERNGLAPTLLLSSPAFARRQKLRQSPSCSNACAAR
jgi:hypothetical protein